MENNKQEDNNLVRLNKFLASNTEFARRKIDEFILQGRVTVKNKVITELGTQINPVSDDVKLDGERVKNKNKKIYLMINKPAGVITSTDDEKHRKTVIDIINIKERIFPIGRLDYETTGLLLLTTDGEFANKLMHPKYKVTKTYLVNISRPLEEKHRVKLSSGIRIEGKHTAPAKISFPIKENYETVSITITEGRNRQVRKMFEHYGYFVRSLHRSGYGHLTLGKMQPGEWRKLTETEINKFFDK